MPPRFAYWTILAGGLPTSFRAAERDELLPTFNRLKEKHPDAEMKYFARGKLWASADEARQALVKPPQGMGDRQRSRSGAGPVERRGRDWRPGGEHRDPRQPFKDAKKARNQDVRKQRWERKAHGAAAAPRVKPHGDKFRDEVPRRSFRPAGRPRFARNQQTPSHPPRPPGPDREPPPARDPKPDPPPRPSEPAIKPPGPPERGWKGKPAPRRRNDDRRRDDGWRRDAGGQRDGSGRRDPGGRRDQGGRRKR